MKKPWLSRAVEWGVLALVLAVLVVVFMHHMRQVQSQAEFAAVRATLGALRTAMIMDFVKQRVQLQTNEPVVPHNPFELLEFPAGNYQGAGRLKQPQSIQRGAWVFDAQCQCVGYKPRFDDAFDSASGNQVAWFEMVGTPVPLMLVPRETYFWNGIPLD